MIFGIFSDIISDAAGALVGGLGMLPSANCGDTFSLCEPVHGSGMRGILWNDIQLFILCTFPVLC